MENSPTDTTTIATTIITTKSTKPKPFSIESLIANTKTESNKRKSSTPPDNVDYYQHQHHNHHQQQQQSSPNQQQHYQNGFPHQTIVNNLPAHFSPSMVYNPWFGYLSQTATERLSQFFSSNSDEKLSHFLDSADPNHRETFSEILFGGPTSLTTAAAAVAANNTTLGVDHPARFLINTHDHQIHREKLAQYFVNNFREPNKEKLSEFLINSSDYVNSGYGVMVGHSGNNVIINDDKDRYSNQTTDSEPELSPNKNNNNILNVNEKSVDLEDSNDSCSDLSLTLSPDGNHKLRGKLSF